MLNANKVFPKLNANKVFPKLNANIVDMEKIETNCILFRKKAKQFSNKYELL